MIVRRLWKVTWIFVLILNWDEKSATALEASSPCVVNDDHCDCGHDELLSSACSYHSSGRLFQCEDNRYFNQSLFLSRVGDGVCDCCDGSDEIHFNITVFCPNVCTAIADDIYTELNARKEIDLKGASQRTAILHDEKVKRRNLKLGYQEAKKTIAEYRELIKDYKIELIGQEKLESTAFDRILELAEFEFTQSLLRFTVENIRRLLAVITLLTGEEGVESILLECDDMYEFDGPEPDDLSAFALVNASASHAHIIEAGKEASIESTVGIREIPTETIDSMVAALSLSRLSLDSLIQVCQHTFHRALVASLNLAECFHHAGVAANLESFPTSPASMKRADHRRSEAEALRKQILDLTSQIKSIQTRSKSSGALSNTVYGPENSLYSLRDSCFSHKHKEHNYEICLFKDVKQGSTLIGTFDKVELKAPAAVSLGRADGIELEGLQENKSIISFYYTTGDICYGTKRPREMVLRLECSTGDAYISEIDEAEICSYSATLRTPLACY
jgi:Glucosidase II beta subunit-like/Glucosidase II beta subunit-like protein